MVASIMSGCGWSSNQVSSPEDIFSWPSETPPSDQLQGEPLPAGAPHGNPTPKGALVDLSLEPRLPPAAGSASGCWAGEPPGTEESEQLPVWAQTIQHSVTQAGCLVLATWGESFPYSHSTNRGL